MKKFVLIVALVVIASAILPFISFDVAADGTTSLTDGKYYNASLATGFIPISTFIQTQRTGKCTVSNGKVASVEYVAMITYEPVIANGLPIDCSWTGDKGIYTSGNNLYSVEVIGTSITVEKEGQTLVYDPILLIDDKSQEPKDKLATLLANDTLQWSYLDGTIVHNIQLGTIEFSDTWVISKNPSGTLQVLENVIKTSGFTGISDTFAYDSEGKTIDITKDKVITAKLFDAAVYPITIDPTIVSINSTGTGNWTVPAGVTSIKVLVVAGGGAGGTSGGGGGAGGVIYNASYPVTAGTNISITIGVGGTGATNTFGGSGGNSSFDTLIAVGGGGGAGNAGSSVNGKNGGSGGGGYGTTGVKGVSNASGQGFDGGNGASAAGGGGGGGNELGANATASNGGKGGNGSDYSAIFGTGIGVSGWVAGGGGGCGITTGAVGGEGGGGTGMKSGGVSPTAGIANTGGGGGGRYGAGIGASGGTGVIVISYEVSSGDVYLTTSQSTGGTVNPSAGTYNYSPSTVVNISGTASACYHFVNWTGNTTDIGDVNAASTNISMGTSNKTATANFAINTSIITYVNGSGGGITGSLSQTINCGSYTTAVTAVPNACYKFVNWSDANTSVSRTDLGTSTNQSFTANFAINTSVITYNANAHGSITGDTPQTVNCSESSTEVTAVPDACYHFTTWDDANVSVSRTDVSTSTNQTFTASFAINTSTITYTAGANGSINGTSPQTINCGANGSLVTAVPDACYYFVNWSDAVATAGRTDLNISANLSVTANFAVYNYTLSVTPSPVAGGNPTFTGSSPFNCSDDVDIFANTSAGYLFTGWTPTTGINNSTLENASVSMTQNRALTAHYIKWSWIQPPTNLSMVENGTNCFNMSWTMGANASATVIVICRDTEWDCSNHDIGNLSDGCWVLYNGADTYFNNSCGLDLDLFEYHITAWGTDGADDWSMTCTETTLGGAEMVDVMYWAIAIFVGLFFTVIAFWQRQWWLFITAGIIWFIVMAFTFTQYTTDDMQYWFGFVYLVLAIVCIGCVFWFREKHEPMAEEPEETQDEKIEKRSKKLAGLRNLSHRMSGRD